MARDSAGVAGSRASLVHSLSARTAQLSHSNAQLREERDYLKVLCWYSFSVENMSKSYRLGSGVVQCLGLPFVSVRQS